MPMIGLAILFGFNLAGVLAQQLLGLPVPGNVIGLMLFTSALFLRWIKLQWVEAAAQFLLSHMMLLFAPFIVGAIAFFPVIGANGLSVAVTLIGGTLLSLWITGAVTQRLQRKGGGAE